MIIRLLQQLYNKDKWESSRLIITWCRWMNLACIDTSSATQPKGNVTSKYTDKDMINGNTALK